MDTRIGSTQPLPGHLYLSLQPDGTLLLERNAQGGACPADPDTLALTGDAVRFER